MNEKFSDNEKNGFYKAIFSRRDVRSKFTSESIDDEVLTRILNAAHHAPSVGFSQPWNFILIKDSETRRRIKKEKIHLNWLKNLEDQNIFHSS